MTDDRWCILRTSAARTLKLAQSLAGAGFEAWTPVQILRRRRPRTSSIRETPVPMAPTFVFARADRLRDLVLLQSSPTSPHPSFSTFRYRDQFPLITDQDMEGLRQAERSADLSFRKTQRHPFQVGQAVRVPEGSFAGMRGVVEQADGRFALVAFGGQMRVKIGAWLLAKDDLHGATVAVSGIAA